MNSLNPHSNQFYKMQEPCHRMLYIDRSITLVLGVLYQLYPLSPVNDVADSDPILQLWHIVAVIRGAFAPAIFGRGILCFQRLSKAKARQNGKPPGKMVVL